MHWNRLAAGSLMHVLVDDALGGTIKRSKMLNSIKTKMVVDVVLSHRRPTEGKLTFNLVLAQSGRLR